jgi:hypothetical protein
MPSNYAIKKEMMYTLKLFAEGTFHWFWNTSPSQIIPCHNFILYSSQRKTCILGGIFKSQTAGKKMGVTPLKFTRAYIDFEE